MATTSKWLKLLSDPEFLEEWRIISSNLQDQSRVIKSTETFLAETPPNQSGPTPRKFNTWTASEAAVASTTSSVESPLLLSVDRKKGLFRAMRRRRQDLSLR